MRVTGEFDVKLVTQPHDDEVGDPAIVRVAIAKHFHGELDAASLGEMLAFRAETQGSAGYVALEKVTGTLAGKRGTFALQHSGTMNRGAASLVVTVVPDSGTDELVRLSGTMAITVADGKHLYDFEYELR